MLYLDSSAFVKRYVREPGRESLEERLGKAESLYSSAICYAEVHAVFARKLRERGWTQDEFAQARNKFEMDWLVVREITVNSETLAPVRELVEHVPLRGMEAIHLAAALWLRRKVHRAPEFLSSDTRLLAAAQQFGFPAWSPVNTT